MSIWTLAPLVSATPFAKELVELTVRLLPLITQIGQVLVQYRRGEPTPEASCQFERDLSDWLRQVGREMVAWIYNQVEPQDRQRMPTQIAWQGEWYRRRPKTPNRTLATLFGTIVLWRFRYEPLEAGLRSIFPLEIQLGIEAGRATPALAERVGQWSVSSTQQTVLSILRRDHGVGWATATLRKVVASLSAGLAEHRQQAQVAQLLGWLKQAEASEGRHRPVLSAGRDGVFLPLRGEDEYREGAAATVSVLDRRGKRLGTVYLGCMPEKGQVTLSQQLTGLLQGVLRLWDGVRPRLEYVTDGGHHPTEYYQRVLTKMEDPRRPGQRLPWVRVIDFYHACLYLGKLAKALFGETGAAYAWAQKMRRWLKDKPHGIYRVLHSAAAHLARRELSGEAVRAYEAAYDYLKKRIKFMSYAAYRRQGLAIGSGVTEAACKTVFTQRLKQSGMSWHVEGGQVIVNLRVLWLSGVWGVAHQSYLASRPQFDRGTALAAYNKTAEKAA